jgi:hypothetical protein
MVELSLLGSNVTQCVVKQFIAVERNSDSTKQIYDFNKPEAFCRLYYVCIQRLRYANETLI